MYKDDKNLTILRDGLEEISILKSPSGVVRFFDLAGEVTTAILCIRKDKIVFGEEYKNRFPAGVFEKPHAWGAAQKDAGDKVAFEIAGGEQFVLFHAQSCCENVVIEDVEGDFQDLIGHPLLQAEEVSNESEEAIREPLATWTFYKLATIKGSVAIRWHGGSNGYYSQRVDFDRIKGAWRPI